MITAMSCFQIVNAVSSYFPNKITCEYHNPMNQRYHMDHMIWSIWYEAHTMSHPQLISKIDEYQWFTSDIQRLISSNLLGILLSGETLDICCFYFTTRHQQLLRHCHNLFWQTLRVQNLQYRRLIWSYSSLFKTDQCLVTKHLSFGQHLSFQVETLKSDFLHHFVANGQCIKEN